MSTRPDPDALLRALQGQRERSGRGRLKLFLGYAPGVGKTFAMLEGAHRAQREGRRVLVGAVETHGRAETAALLAGLEVLPRRIQERGGSRFEEFDLDAALRSGAELVLLDELAHTNAPGSRHAHRHHDVAELLAAGIEVHTALNVQHLASLQDVVQRITAIRVRETVPDALLAQADEVELVDLPPAELVARLEQGRVYPPEQAARARAHFFRSGNLLALRELALRAAAERVDADVRAFRSAHAVATTWPTSERLLACIGPSPESERLVRAAHRIATGLHAPWMAVSVERSGAAPLDAADRLRLDRHLELARVLGAEVVRLTAHQVAPALVEHARRQNVSRIVLGRPRHSRWRDRLRGSLLDEVVRASDGIDVLVVTGVGEAAAVNAPPDEPWSVPEGLGAAAVIGLATLLGLLLDSWVGLPDLAMLELLGISLVAARWGRRASLLASALAVAAFDFCFVPPRFTFAVSDAQHLLTFASMFGAGVVVSGLTSRLRVQEQEAVARAQRVGAQLDLARALSRAGSVAEASQALVQQAAVVSGARASVFTAGIEGGLVLREGDALDAPAMAVAQWVQLHGRPAGLGTETLPGSRVFCLPLREEGEPQGVLALALERAPGGETRFLLDTFVRQTVAALERIRLESLASRAELEVRAEATRSALLSSVSHDLRTPLAAITGTATTLRDAALPEPERRALLDSLVEQGARLERLVGNLLEMTRLDAGAVLPRREEVVVEEVVGAALHRLGRALDGRALTLDVPSALPSVSGDPVLLEQLLFNLLDNAVRHAPAPAPLHVRASAREGLVELAVEDRGPGFAPGEAERLFERFFRGRGAAAGGSGLGLAIARAIAQAHGGELVAQEREGGGASFVLRLPAAPSSPGPVEAG